MKHLLMTFLCLMAALAATLPAQAMGRRGPSWAKAVPAPGPSFAESFGLAGGFAEEEIRLTIEAGVRSYRSDFSPVHAHQRALLRDFILSGGRPVLAVPNLPIKADYAEATAMFETWKDDIRKSLLYPMGSIVPGATGVLADVLKGVDGLNERDFVDCIGYPSGPGPCSANNGDKMNFVEGSIQLRRLMDETGYSGRLPLIGGSIVLLRQGNFMSSVVSTIRNGLFPSASQYPGLMDLSPFVDHANPHVYLTSGKDDFGMLRRPIEEYKRVLPQGKAPWMTEWGVFRLWDDYRFTAYLFSQYAEFKRLGGGDFHLYGVFDRTMNTSLSHLVRKDITTGEWIRHGSFHTLTNLIRITGKDAPASPPTEPLEWLLSAASNKGMAFAGAQSHYLLVSGTQVGAQSVTFKRTLQSARLCQLGQPACAWEDALISTTGPGLTQVDFRISEAQPYPVLIEIH